MIQVFDENGQELTYLTVNTICPVEYKDEARMIAFKFLTEVVGTEDTLESMLTTKLGPIGGPVTHIFCSIQNFQKHVDMEVDYITTQGRPWCATKEYSVNDDIEEMKSKFCCIVGDASVLLARLGLEIING